MGGIKGNGPISLVSKPSQSGAKYVSRSVPFLLLFLMICLNCAHPCAMFTLARNGLVLFANNEDYIKPGYVWFTPGEEGKYGRINFGFNDHFAQGSMNEAGLCFDAATVPEIPFEPDPSKKKVKNLPEKIMDECATSCLLTPSGG